jgi:hypothetical protein
VGDDVAEAVESLRARIGFLRIPEEYEHRHARGREMGASLEFIVESIESLVMPVDPKRLSCWCCSSRAIVWRWRIAGTMILRLLVHLPGDIVIDRPGFKFFFPITTMLIVSAVLSLIAWLMRR